MSKIELYGIDIEIEKSGKFWVDINAIKIFDERREDFLLLFHSDYRRQIENGIATAARNSRQSTLNEKVFIFYWGLAGDVSIGCSMKYISDLLQVFADETIKTEIMREAFSQI